MNPTLSPKWVLTIIAIGVIAVALLAERGVSWWQTRSAVNAATAPLEAKVEATAGMTQDAVAADSDRAQASEATAAGRTIFIEHTTRNEANEPHVRSRADQPVPDSVRNAFKARRLARERSGNAAREREARPAADETP
jgi:uncharacterized SAM-binding protein YcdF (DUF218 family)